MTPAELALLAAGILVIAFLYSSVGHAGASGYIATMSLFGLAPADIKPTALVLNVLVATIATWQFWRAGHFRWALFWPFALLSMPLAFAGGYLQLPADVFRVVVGIVLLFSAARFLLRPTPDADVRPAPKSVAIPVGGGLGLLAGLTGTGGGIFLTPLLLLMRWSTAKAAAGVSALFILGNSVAGLVGNIASTERIPSYVGVLAGAAIAGGTAGSYFGSRHFQAATIKRLLAGVLLIAGAKLILT